MPPCPPRRLLCILLLGSLVPFFSSLVAASTAALWDPAGPWASSAAGFAALLVPGAVCLALLAADVCAAMGISPREALAYGRWVGCPTLRQAGNRSGHGEQLEMCEGRWCSCCGRGHPSAATGV